MDELTQALIENQAKEAVAERGDLGSLLRDYIQYEFAMHLDVCLPVKILSVDRVTRLVTVAPLIKALSRASGQLERQNITCTAFQFAANGFVIDFPLRVGDVGWCLAADRCVTDATTTHEVQDIKRTDTHKFDFGIFIPDYFRTLMDYNRENALSPYTGEDNRLVISSMDGKQRISIGRAVQTGETGSATGDICVESCTDASNKTTVEIKNGTLTITASEVTVNGNLTVTGNITSTGGEITDKRGVVLGTHVHTSTAIGTNTTPPVVG